MAAPSSAVAERRADRAVGGARGHHQQRRTAPVAALDGVHLAQPDVEEREAVDGLYQRLDDAAHARRHAAGEHHERRPRRDGGQRRRAPRPRAYSAVPGVGSGSTSPGAGGSTMPSTTFVTRPLLGQGVGRPQHADLGDDRRDQLGRA